MRPRLLATVLVPIAAISLATPALATGPVMPPSMPQTPEAQFFYDMWFGPTDPDWSPQGTVVADSGFRPTPNGFPYVNYGGSFSPFNLFFDMPDNELQPMTSPYMRSLYGDGVCAGPVQSDGSCALTPAAVYMSEAILDQVDGVGHCVGFAIASAGLFNGQIEPSEVAALTLGGQSRLTLDTQNVIARNWATQLTVPITSLTPAEVVEQLIEEFQTPGNVGSIIRISWRTASGGFEGHGITPFAVYDKGNGQFDIAVYDNNYPFQSRAIHVDVVANTWEYQVLLNPSAPATIATGDATTLSLQLQSVADSLAVQPCPVCRGGRETNLVVMNPLPAAVAESVDVDLLEPTGSPLPADRVSILPSVDSGNPDLVSFPAFDIDPGDGFTYLVTDTGSPAAFPLTVTDISVSGVKQVSVPAFPPGATATIDFDLQGVLAFGANVALKPRMNRVFTQGARHYETTVYGGATVAGGNSRAIALQRQEGRVLYGDARAAGGSMTVNAALQRSASTVKYRAVNVAYPAGGQLVLDYGSWTRVNQRPVFGVDRDGDGTIDVRIPMTRVR